MNEQTNIMDIVNMIIKRWWVLLCAICIAGLITFSISQYFIEPKYASAGKLLVSTNTEYTAEDINIGTINTSTRLVSTYIQIFKTNTFLKRIANTSGLNYTEQQIQKMLSLSPLEETEVLEVKITCPSPTDAKILTEMILDNAQEEIDRIGHGGYVSIIDEASTPTEPASPNVQLNTIIGVLIGAFLGVLIIFVIELLDTRIKGEEDLVSRYELPILGVIPSVQNSDK